ncbi:MAG: bifunctional diaminohydroxyphosphoribosylaminopyrimidine deaminase/5-amino-6-(5-phosphoribosylamino)uracil reductase RibD [bacterium]
MKNNDELYMAIAIELAKKGLGHTSPNPLVGCVIVKNGNVISTGWHKKAGQPHAEAEALENIKYKAKGATLYVNLEPCCHWGKTAPCTEAIIKYGIKKVVMAMTDPNPKVNSKGKNILKKAGIKVVTGVLEKQAQQLNRIFIKNITQKKPYIIMKAGISLDGKMALSNGTSKWITGPHTRIYSQNLRKECDAIVAGINTIIKDNPYLDCRIDKNKKIKKVILDTYGKIPLNANIFKYSSPQDIFIFSRSMSVVKIKTLSKRGVNVIIQKSTGEIDLKKAVSYLFSLGIGSMLVEGGGTLHTAFLKAKLYDEARLYIAPIFIGNDGLAVIGKTGLKNLNNALNLNNVEVIKLGKDTLIKGEFNYV